jgi:AcrR family transcriptional regulator
VSNTEAPSRSERAGVTRSPGTSSRSAAAAARRQQLLEVAEALFLDAGYGKTSVSRIVKTAGVAQGTFYLYFASKEAILLELRRGVLRRLRRSFKQAARSSAGAADARLAAGFVAVAAEVVRNIPLLRQFRSAETAVQTEQVVLDGRASMAAPIEALIHDGVATHTFVVDSVPIAAHVALSLFSDLIYTSAAYGEPASTDVLVPATTRLLLRGLGVAPSRIDALIPAPETS